MPRYTGSFHAGSRPAYLYHNVTYPTPDKGLTYPYFMTSYLTPVKRDG